MKIGNFLFPESGNPDKDGSVIDETMQEALLSERLGVHTLWLAEHHFDGNCAYVDPVSFAAALAAATHRIRIASRSRRCHCTIRFASPSNFLSLTTSAREG